MPFKSPHPLYNVWRSMRERCSSPRCRVWKNYGGRGIKVCPEWQASFAAFLKDMGPRPNGTTLDRINNDGDYEPSNCRWADHKTQLRNTRRALFVDVQGVRYRAIELTDRCGLKTDTIVERANAGLSLEEVLSTEKRVYKPGLALGGKASGAVKQARTHCKNGHQFTPENTLVNKHGHRACRRCHADRERWKRQSS